MTKEKAIKILKEIIEEGWLISDLDKCIAIDACEMAIKALEQEPCEDTISRKQALEIVDNMFMGERNHKSKALDEIKFLPSVTPAQNVCEDAVSKQVVKEQMIRYGFLSLDMTVTKFVKNLPSIRTEKTGHWIVLKDEYNDVVEAVCSCCDRNGNYKWNFCPNCGAKMEKVEE